MYAIKRIHKKVGLFIFAIYLFFALIIFNTEETKADELDSAYSFYLTYGNEMLFQSGENSEGDIYYATKAKKASAGIQYTTLGWKVTIWNGSEIVVDTLYYQLGGENMICVNIESIDGYEYCLYKVTLSNLRMRMNDEGRAALKGADANIIFDACTTVKKNGVAQGAMTDEGPSEGTVYETYEGIVSAQQWSSDTKETLKTYYNKSVQGLFYNVTVVGGTGIEAVSGSGRYCFGTAVTISAKVQKGYHFKSWTGSKEIDRQNYFFLLGNEDIYLYAEGELNSYHLLFDPNGGTGHISTLTAHYYHKLMPPEKSFVKEGARLCGWSTQINSTVAELPLRQVVEISTLVDRLRLGNVNNGTIILYAIWDYEPVITGEDVYVSLEDARNGKITEEWLSNYVSAEDREDGEIFFGKNDRNEFSFINYLQTDFTKFQKDGSVTETVRAIDSAGNRTQKTITIHIVDTTLYSADLFLGTPRFISEKYYKDVNGDFVEEKCGGLKNSSKWRSDSSYTEVLDMIFNK